MNKFFRFCLVVACLLLVVAGGSVFVWWLQRPPMVTARAIILVRGRQPDLLEERPFMPVDNHAYDSYRDSTVAMIKSPIVLNTAITDKLVAETFLRDVKKPNKWLRDHLQVKFEGNTEILHVSLTETKDHQQDLVRIVDAICAETLAVSGQWERAESEEAYSILKAERNRLRGRIGELTDAYRKLQVEPGVDDKRASEVHTQILLMRLSIKLNDLNVCENEVRSAQIDYSNWKLRADNAVLRIQAIDKRVSADPEVLRMKADIETLQAKLVNGDPQSEEAEDSRTKDIQAELADKKEQLTQKQTELSEQVAKRLDLEKELTTEAYKRKCVMLTTQIKFLKEGFDSVSDGGEVVHEMGIDELEQNLIKCRYQNLI
ncbi:GumC domain-containing protein [Aeoliella mucimassa]|uniref:hypothetical protein n=1 Tax=Aeoliella mucimassa TaxID=2527972 RepID=UPI0011A250E4|nr:hypothetical protein [Aeoliella mucimassa]